MLKSIKISLILASDWSSAIKIVMNIDESGFRMPLSFSRQMAPVVWISYASLIQSPDGASCFLDRKTKSALINIHNYLNCCRLIRDQD